ncbi:MAG: hypothetical protein EPN43_07620 [Jatrophihabitans sp.]|nr:MAG: hypothetical protein EPN43_07620 [Jatrophihabitans sp.]
MPTLPAMPVFSRADLRAHGWSDSATWRAVRGGRLLRLRHDQFTLAPTQPRDAAVAAARACAGSVISHRSAAVVHGLPLLGPPPRRPDLTVEPRGTGDVPAALLHRATLPNGDVVTVDGACLTSVARTVVDLARTVPAAAAVVAADNALQRRLTTPLEIVEVVDACARWPGIRRARAALRQVDGRSESPLESLSRLVVARLDLPRPQLQVRIRDARGWVVARTDFYWDDVGAAGEADGRAKYTDREVLTREKRRQEELEDLGVSIARWGWLDTRTPELLAARVRNARERGRRRDASGFSRGWEVELTAPLTLPL